MPMKAYSKSKNSTIEIDELIKQENIEEKTILIR